VDVEENDKEKEKKSNERVLKEIREQRNLMNSIRKRKNRFIGHIIRHNNFIRNIFKGKVLGRRLRGRPRQSFFQDNLCSI